MIRAIKNFISHIRQSWAASYTKRLVTFIVINAVIWVWASYILAFLGRVEIAESLSSKAVDAILGTLIAYAAKALFENINKHGGISIKKSSSIKRDFQ